MAEPYEGQLPLSAIEVDEEFWGPGSAPIVTQWLRENYDPDTMPRLVTSTIQGREGYWLLGWKNEGTEFHSLLATIFGEAYAVAQLDQVNAAHPRGELCLRCHANRFTPYGVTRRDGDPPPPALSRVDNKTYICSYCGQDEAMRDFAGLPPVPPEDWPIIPRGSFGMGAL